MRYSYLLRYNIDNKNYSIWILDNYNPKRHFIANTQTKSEIYKCVLELRDTIHFRGIDTVDVISEAIDNAYWAVAPIDPGHIWKVPADLPNFSVKYIMAKSFNEALLLHKLHC